ncbi:8-amino-7-oxononanoate synthase [Oleiagrimonas sp. C23AA]|uniref:8-amino-7-oxononanoate synthase n=1 Tax=Oleiagrimonas sp. C23AA TaxID=2719047 RepID=UPI001423F205|nr:8-amino-7-oxononanoate synthase [Oleiagrimonas sp. C23AA]NII12238.1 8-amino-7-oxononanoate synthase [Oleiagrimonas sp. C23AA]
MNRPDLLDGLAHATAERRQQGLYRQLAAVQRAAPGRAVIDGRQYLLFASNDYLGLAHHPLLIRRLRDAAEQGVGAGAAHLVSGHHREHARLEAMLAEWTGRERALLFSSGIMANLGVMQALLDRPGTRQASLCVQDKLNHASLIDGARASGATLRRYPHGDVAAAARQLESAPEAPALLATDGVFSMDGDLAPLPELAALCERQGATLMVDDAHGLGVLGPEGGGSLAAAGLSQAQAPVLMGTLGKALGTAGAFVAGSAALIDGLVQFARSFIYTTALPPALASATCTAIELVRQESWRREHLAALIARFRHGAAQLDLPLMDSPTPIQPLRLGSSHAVLEASQMLRDTGFLVGAIRPPTVPAGQARLRITLSAAHQPDDVDRLLDALARIPHPSDTCAN